MSEVEKFKQCEKVFNDYISIDSINDANIIRQDIRLLSKISTSSNTGGEIKQRFVERLSTLIQEGKDHNLKALRNINWTAFSKGEENAKNIVSLFIKTALEKDDSKELQALSEVIDLSVDETPKNWWHFAISEAIQSTFKKGSPLVLKNIWQLMDLSKNTLRNLLSTIDSIRDCDFTLRKFIPKKLRDETCKALTIITNKKNWYLLHADILLKQFSPEIALEKQLSVERKLTLVESIGVKYLSEKLTPKNLISLALKSCDKKLIDLSVEAILKNNLLLKNIDLTFSCWLEIWTCVVLKTGKVFDGLSGKEQVTVFTILDLIRDGKKVDDTIVSLITDTAFSNISQYKSRRKIWKELSPLNKENFIISTFQSVLKDLLTGKIEANSIEPEIADRIISDICMTKFLSENRYDIELVIKVYASFANLKDTFLADYIYYYSGVISEVQAKNLGNLVLVNNFSKSARSIYDKAKYNNSFKPAYEICKELVDYNWLESMWGSVSAAILPRQSHNSNSDFSPSFSYENMIRKELPTVVILTAINDEYLAVRKHLTEIVEADQNDTSYEAGIFEFNGKEIAKIFIRECGAKNIIAAQETERAIQYFKPQMMLFVGIAGSRKPNDFAIGDVIFPEKVYSYEGGKAEKDAFAARPDIADMTYFLKELAKKERRKDEWKVLIKGDWQPDIKANLGVIASGEQLIEHYHSDIGKILTKHYNDTSAVEMEGFGFAKAAARQGRETSHIFIGVVRGISDIIEQSGKKNSRNTDRRPANAKEIASDTSAAFAFWLIFKTYGAK